MSYCVLQIILFASINVKQLDFLLYFPLLLMLDFDWTVYQSCDTRGSLSATPDGTGSCQCKVMTNLSFFSKNLIICKNYARFICSDVIAVTM